MERASSPKVTDCLVQYFSKGVVAFAICIVYSTVTSSNINLEPKSYRKTIKSIKEYKRMIVGLIAMYMPKSDEIENISKYIGELDYCFLLDDSTKDNSNVVQTLLKKYTNKVEYYLNEHNMGLCASVNNGFKLAIEKGADWILVMNPDGTFQNNAISIFRNYIENNDTKNVGIISPRFNIDRRPKKVGTGTKEVRYPDMTGCLYSAKVLTEIGFYDQNTYFYGLDLEYCLRVLKNGYKIIECSEAVLNHKPAETFNVKFLGKTILKCGIDTPQRYYYQFRSAYYICKKYCSFYCFAFHVYKWLKVVLFFDNKKEYFKMIKMGIHDAKRGFYGKLRKDGEKMS